LKELETRLQERPRHRYSSNGQVNSVEESNDNDPGEEEFVPLDSNVEACIVVLDGYEEVSTKSNASSIDLNLVEDSTSQPSHWNLDFGATHHVNGNKEVFHMLRCISTTNLRSIRGQGYNVTCVGDAHFQFYSRTVKNNLEVMYFPSI
jgi:hypothetical protein